MTGFLRAGFRDLAGPERRSWLEGAARQAARALRANPADSLARQALRALTAQAAREGVDLEVEP